MEITYQLTEKDFVQAYIAHRKRSPFGKWTYRVELSVMPLLAIAIIFGLVLQHGVRLTKDYFPFLWLVLLWILILEIWPRWTMKQQFRKQPGAHGPRAVTFDGDGTRWRWDGGSSEIEWKNYIRWIDGEDQFLFYTSPACFNILPTRNLQPAQVAELRELLNQNIRTAK